MSILMMHAVEGMPIVHTQCCVGARCPLIQPCLLQAPSESAKEHKERIPKPQNELLVEIAGMSFHLDKFPLVSKSGRLNRLVLELHRTCEKNHIKLDDVPGGAEAFELAVKFCYGLALELTPANVAALRCVAEYLEMTDDVEEGNLVSKTEAFLTSGVLASWTDSITVLQSCERLMPWAEQLVKRCGESVAWKACTDPRGIRWSYSGSCDSPPTAGPWNGINSTATAKQVSPDWWFEDASHLRFYSFTKVMAAIKVKCMKSDLMGAAIEFYAQKWLPGLIPAAVKEKGGSPRIEKMFHASSSPPKEPVNCLDVVSKGENGPTRDEYISVQNKNRTIIEGIVSMLPPQKDTVSCSFLLRLLRAANMSNAAPTSKKELEKRVGMQLEQATLSDILIPCFAHTSETLYDTDLVHRILENFLLQDQNIPMSPKHILTGVEKNWVFELGASTKPPAAPHTAKMKVAKLIDSYLAEVARDSKLPVSKFQALAEALPEFSRVSDDGLYRAIDTFLKAHPGLMEHERKKLCRIMDCRRLSLDACMHAAQNERLPLRIVVQVLFAEQVKLRNAITGSPAVRADYTPDPPLQREPTAAAQQTVTKLDNSVPSAKSMHESAQSTGLDIKALKHDVDEIKAKYRVLETTISQQVERLTKTKSSSWSSPWKRLSKNFFNHKNSDRVLGSDSITEKRTSRRWRNSIS